jgi:hypothetical protein
LGTLGFTILVDGTKLGAKYIEGLAVSMSHSLSRTSIDVALAVEAMMTHFGSLGT